MNGTVIEQAMAYASRGWPVFPCQPGTKAPATRHGFRDATTDPSQIERWWQHQPAANLAIATGAPGPDVLDVDHHGPAGNGYAALARLSAAGLLDGAGTIIRTPSGGMHAYFTGSDQPSRRLLSQHLDLRAQDGYVLAPPSCVNGTGYAFHRQRSAVGGLDWAKVIAILEPGKTAAGDPVARARDDLSGLVAWTAALGPDSHNRNDGLFWAACRAAEAGDEAVLAAIAEAARSTGLTDRETRRTIDSAWRTVTRRTREPECEQREGTQ